MSYRTRPCNRRRQLRQTALRMACWARGTLAKQRRASSSGIAGMRPTRHGSSGLAPRRLLLEPFSDVIVDRDCTIPTLPTKQWSTTRKISPVPLLTVFHRIGSQNWTEECLHCLRQIELLGAKISKQCYQTRGTESTPGLSSPSVWTTFSFSYIVHYLRNGTPHTDSFQAKNHECLLAFINTPWTYMPHIINQSCMIKSLNPSSRNPIQRIGNSETLSFSTLTSNCRSSHNPGFKSVASSSSNVSITENIEPCICG